MKWIVDYGLLGSFERQELLFHKVLPFFLEGAHIFVFALHERLSLEQEDFLEGLFPSKIPVIMKAESIEALQDLYDDYKGFETIPGLANMIFYQGICQRASDIHFEPLETSGRIRLRIDGELYTFKEIPLHIWKGLINRIKILSKLRLDETKRPQMGRHSVFFHHKEIDLRFSSHPTIFGESIVVRILDKHLKPLNLQELEFEEGFCRELSSLLKIPYGLIIFTGPTGSGKTTTLFALLNQLNTPAINIMTLEDPVEYILEGAKQTEIKPGTLEEFNEGIRSILRQDPDVILIGEMRDEETARMAFRAAMTGHKVFSTLHANTAFQVIQRLTDLGLPLNLISGNLKGIISQRLVRKIAPQSASGFLGRIPIGEIIKIDETLDEMIARGDSIHAMEKYALSQNFVPLKEYAMNLARKNLTTLQEIEKAVL